MVTSTDLVSALIFTEGILELGREANHIEADETGRSYAIERGHVNDTSAC